MSPLVIRNSSHKLLRSPELKSKEHVSAMYDNLTPYSEPNPKLQLEFGDITAMELETKCTTN